MIHQQSLENFLLIVHKNYHRDQKLDNEQWIRDFEALNLKWQFFFQASSTKGPRIYIFGKKERLNELRVVDEP